MHPITSRLGKTLRTQRRKVLGDQYWKAIELGDIVKAIFSSICRVDNEALLSIAQPGIVNIPADILSPRQCRITGVESVPATLKSHRGQLIPCVSTSVASKLVADGMAEYLEQKLLTYTHADYISDADVKDNAEEIKRVEGHDLVVVAVIGDNRSALAVCRNIVSGCQDESSLVKDAQGALDASSVFLIED